MFTQPQSIMCRLKKNVQLRLAGDAKVFEKGPSGKFSISSTINVPNFTFQRFTTWCCGLPLTLNMKKKAFCVLFIHSTCVMFFTFDIMRMFSHMGLYFLQQFEMKNV